MFRINLTVQILQYSNEIRSAVSTRRESALCFCLLADMIFLLDPNNFLMITKKSTSHDALRIVLVDFFCKEIKN